MKEYYVLFAALLAGHSRVWALSTYSSGLRGEVHSSVQVDSTRGFSYAMHGHDWTDGFCLRQSGQSPIDLAAGPPPGGSFSYRYNPSTAPLDLKNDGNALAIDVAGLNLGGLMYNGNWYYLLSVTAKAVSEHTFAGAHMPVELHMVHKRQDNGDLVIIAVPLSCATPLAFGGPAPGPGPAPAPGPWHLAPGPGPGHSPAPSPVGAPVAAPAFAPAFAPGPRGPVPKPCGGPSPGPCGGPSPGPEPFMATGFAPAPMLVGMAHFVPFVAGEFYLPPAIDEPNFNPVVQAFMKLPPPPPQKQVLIPASLWEPLDFTHLIAGTAPAAAGPAPAPAPDHAAPAAASAPGPPVPFYAYNGSTTVPPCASNVAWFVREQPVMISDTQALFLHDALFALSGGTGNFRATQPLGSRQVTLWQGINEVAPVPSVPVNLHNDWTEREVRVRDLSNGALKTASGAATWASGMDRTMTGAARALRDSLSEIPR
mmetsp:Transcript_132775/g.424795  ORF Transcript_132775/g.424795 Transcript_132775/m.424795 type:complete len:481 (+) Transcript_132775:188-1630(+)|eukprot:CAMPEP_0204125638 /NCGR_PEP_ID=MMETSP0361-20130328/10546_1 /ASSEMBLY_ACC=CAM_ASM_000343 /TAXON_ID=268821 /ORGANISM="Scrippsiella Hangoei, Strain SHTV-5" /LENGTH=480 /DNA_ID=CAMNT_0051077395 /DNA_START=166 /DNA_END=1608 /DNA_ORIENTATION=-